MHDMLQHAAHLLHQLVLASGTMLLGVHTAAKPCQACA
jgi:hypothetical protein